MYLLVPEQNNKEIKSSVQETSVRSFGTLDFDEFLSGFLVFFYEAHYDTLVHLHL